MTGVASNFHFAVRNANRATPVSLKRNTIRPSGGDADGRWRGGPFGYFGFGLQPVFDLVAGLSSALLVELKCEQTDFVVIARFGRIHFRAEDASGKP